MTKPAGVLAVAGLIAAGGLTGASPAACLSPWLCPMPVSTAAPAGAMATARALHTASQTADPASSSEITLDELQSAIDRLGAFEYADRLKAAQLVRRTRGTLTLPALIEAASAHADGYVRYKALVLLSGYDDPRVAEQMAQAMRDPNDRLRAVAYQYFERHPEPRLVPTFVEVFDKELAEFVRPALVRAMAALGDEPRVRSLLLRDVTRGQDFFRSTVIHALGDYKAVWAVEAISGVARLEGPLQDDAVLALGRIGDPSVIGLLAGLQRTAPRETQPTIAAALCLLGRNCDLHRRFLVRTLTFADETMGYQELLRSASTGLGAIAATGDVEAVRAMLDTGIPSVDPTRAPVALALAEMALDNPSFLLETMMKRSDYREAVELLREGFDMLEEDFAEEQFYVTARRAFWAAPEGSAARSMAETVVQMLEF